MCDGPEDANVGDACDVDCDCASISTLFGRCSHGFFPGGSALPEPVCIGEGGTPAPPLPAIRRCDRGHGVVVGQTNVSCQPACEIDAKGSHGCRGQDACHYLGYDADERKAWGVCSGGCTSNDDCPGREVCQPDTGLCRSRSASYAVTKDVGERCAKGDDGEKCSCLLPARAELEAGSFGMCTRVCRMGEAACPEGFTCDAQVPSVDLQTGDELFSQVPSGTWGKCVKLCEYDSDCFAVGGFCESHAGMAGQKSCEIGLRPAGSCPPEAVESSSGLTLAGFPLRIGSDTVPGISAGPADSVWFTQDSANVIGRITPCGLVTTFTGLTADSAPHAIVAGPDGNLWFSEREGNRIGKLTPDGLVTEFPLTTPDARPEALVLGPDGNLWFTERAGNLGRIEPASGAILEFGIQQELRGVAAGPDERLWFTETLANRIGAISLTGEITEYDIPTAASGPFGITQGPDQALWFTESAADKIGRITPAGELSEYALPNAGSFPTAITLGPDGNLWFVETLGNRIGRITPTGVLTEYSLPPPARAPSAISPGPAGTLWFTESATGRVVRFTPPAEASSRRFPARR
jgi:virginiamycin B lyase